MTNLEKLRLFIEHAPSVSSLPESDLIGVQGEGFMICRSCLSRIQQRGCSIPAPNQLIWNDDGIAVDCDLKEYH
jgi:hypothetical protein